MTFRRAPSGYATDGLGSILMDGGAVPPDEMVEILGFSGDQAGFDAEWKSRPPGLTASLR